MDEKARTYEVAAYGPASAASGLAGLTIPRREPGPQDVQIEIHYCRVCHSDLHQMRNEWSHALPTVYPCVPAIRTLEHGPGCHGDRIPITRP